MEQFTSNTIVDLDEQYVWHPFTQMKGRAPPLVIEKGEGSYLYTEEGTRYIDAISSWWVNLHGHCHPYIAKAIQDQIQKLEHVLFSDCTHTPGTLYAQKLIQTLPEGFSKVFYSDNGSTAVEAAIKMALQYWYNKKIPKKTIISFEHGYHGDTFGSMSSSGRNYFNTPFWNHLFETIQIPTPCHGKEEISIQKAEHILKSLDSVAAFIYEPLLQGACGMKTYSQKGLNTLLTLFRQHNVLLIADEVLTGFGRVGTLFASDMIEVKPDIICLSKGITGGFLPLGVTATTKAIYDAFYTNHSSSAFLHGHSYTGNPIACRAALASLDLLLEKECSIKRKAIEESHIFLKKKLYGHKKIARIEVMGTILIVEYTTDGPRSYENTIKRRLFDYFIQHKILIRPLGNVLYIMPPYSISSGDLEHIYNTIKASLEEIV